VKPNLLNSPQTWRTLSVVIFIGILICTLWPFNPFPANKTDWVSGSPGIDFRIPGVALTRDPLTFERAEPGNSSTLELLLQPAGVGFGGAILNVYTRSAPKHFTVRQWRDGLLVTHDLDLQGHFRRQKFDVDHAFKAGKTILVTISSGTNGTRVYLDGKLARDFPKFVITRQELSGELAMGNSATDYEPWPGKLKGFAVYSRELTDVEAAQHYQAWMSSASQPDLEGAVARYAFTEGQGAVAHNEISAEPDLLIPTAFQIPHKFLLKSPLREYRDDGKFHKDFIVNVIGFIPLGFLLGGYWTLTKNPRFALFCAVLSCGTFSFFIEFTQAFIPSRGSGWTDVISNSLGGLVGAILAQTFLRWIELGQKEASQAWH